MGEKSYKFRQLFQDNNTEIKSLDLKGFVGFLRESARKAF